MSFCGLCFMCLSGVLFLSLSAQGDTPPATQPSPASQGAEADLSILKTLQPRHPRLVASPADIDRVRRMVKEHDQPRLWHEALVKKAQKLLDTPPLEYKLIGPRLLQVSRDAVDRIYTLGLLYRLDADKRYAARGVKELLAFSAFDDWHPSHFLDTAEMTHAAGIGYDWFYDVLTGEQRAVVRKAIIEKGLEVAAPGYRGDKVGWWARCNHNWNQVCNGGLAIGALAIADEVPQLAAFILNSALASLPKAMHEYGPDGGWAEGPGYWSYATRYTVYLLAAMQTALGTDRGLSKTPGFDRAGDFRFYFVGPTDLAFNYADASDKAGSPAEMFWLGRRFDQPLYAWHERQCKSDGDAMNLLWFDPRGDGPKAADLPLDRVFRGVNVAFLRSAWEYKDALFVGFKGGDNKANHSHLDLGTFVLDALGQRWALDLGSDDYNMPDYFGDKRFTYYRLRTEGHNTLVIDGRNQAQDAFAAIIAFGSHPDRAFAVADLTAAYRPAANRVHRGVALLGRNHVLIQDEIDASGPVQPVWAMHTRAKIDLAGNIATLTLGDVHLQARIISPEDGKFEVVSVEAPPPQNPNKGVQKLLIRGPRGSGPAIIAVLLTPYRDAPAKLQYQTEPLGDWR
jgi:hypothetical protein